MRHEHGSWVIFQLGARKCPHQLGHDALAVGQLRAPCAIVQATTAAAAASTAKRGCRCCAGAPAAMGLQVLPPAGAGCACDGGD